MPIHLVVHLPDGRSAWIDSREPIAARPKGAAARCLKAVMELRTQPADAVAEVTAWLDTHEQQSDLCRKSCGMIPRPDCGHEPQEEDQDVHT